MDFGLTEGEKATLLRAAREAIAGRLQRQEPAAPPATPALRERCGAFVTLHKGGRLRGCIGYVEARKPLLETVREMAVASAFQDPRFPPLGPEELPQVDIEISVLSPLRRIESAEEIQVGVHGVMLSRGFNSGLLLPQVATEYGWDRETFLDHTCRKAGLPAGCWRRVDARIEIFSAVVFGEKRREPPVEERG